MSNAYATKKGREGKALSGYVTPEQIREVLRPSLGSAVLEQTGLSEGAARLLLRFAPYRETLEDLAQRVESYLFDTLYGFLGDDMTVMTDDGQLRRIRMRELPRLADDVMGVLFDHMQVYSIAYEKLKDYSLRSGSLSAMRVLYQKYDAFQPAEEKELIARIIRDNYPPERYADWLK